MCSLTIGCACGISFLWRQVDQTTIHENWQNHARHIVEGKPFLFSQVSDVSNEIYYLRTVVPTKLQDPRLIVISLMPTPDDDEAIRSNRCTSMKTWNLINFDRVVNCLVVNCCKLRFSAKTCQQLLGAE